MTDNSRIFYANYKKQYNMCIFLTVSKNTNLRVTYQQSY
jgi:hypothetical protein